MRSEWVRKCYNSQVFLSRREDHRKALLDSQPGSASKGCIWPTLTPSHPHELIFLTTISEWNLSWGGTTIISQLETVFPVFKPLPPFQSRPWVLCLLLVVDRVHYQVVIPVDEERRCYQERIMFCACFNNFFLLIFWMGCQMDWTQVQRQRKKRELIERGTRRRGGGGLEGGGKVASISYNFYWQSK